MTELTSESPFQSITPVEFLSYIDSRGLDFIALRKYTQIGYSQLIGRMPVGGIVAYGGHQEAWPIILEGLRRLEYRGYDSAGIAVIDSSGEIQFRKTVGKVGGLDSRNPVDSLATPAGLQGSVGLGHTRWATHGRPSDANAHPHTDCHGRIAVVHNGIVENFLE